MLFFAFESEVFTLILPVEPAVNSAFSPSKKWSVPVILFSTVIITSSKTSLPSFAAAVITYSPLSIALKVAVPSVFIVRTLSVTSVFPSITFQLTSALVAFNGVIAALIAISSSVKHSVLPAEISIEDTGIVCCSSVTFIFTLAVFLPSSVVTVIVVCPLPTAVTSPLSSTVATPLSELSKTSFLLVAFAGVIVAISLAVSPFLSVSTPPSTASATLSTATVSPGFAAATSFNSPFSTAKIILLMLSPILDEL